MRTGVAAGRGRHHIRSLLRRQAGSFVGGAGQLQVERLQESRLPHQGFRRTCVRVGFCLFADKLLFKSVNKLMMIFVC